MIFYGNTFDFGYLNRPNENMTIVPGFKFRWFYSEKFDNQFQYEDDIISMAFVREFSK